MMRPDSPLSPDRWLHDLFTSKAVMNGEVIRRKARDVERFAGMENFMREIHRRGYSVAENAGQLVIFCNRAPVRWLTPPPDSPPPKNLPHPTPTRPPLS